MDQKGNTSERNWDLIENFARQLYPRAYRLLDKNERDAIIESIEKGENEKKSEPVHERMKGDLNLQSIIDPDFLSQTLHHGYEIIGWVLTIILWRFPYHSPNNPKKQTDEPDQEDYVGYALKINESVKELDEKSIKELIKIATKFNHLLSIHFKNESDKK